MSAMVPTRSEGIIIDDNNNQESSVGSGSVGISAHEDSRIIAGLFYRSLSWERINGHRRIMQHSQRQRKRDRRRRLDDGNNDQDHNNDENENEQDDANNGNDNADGNDEDKNNDDTAAADENDDQQQQQQQQQDDQDEDQGQDNDEDQGDDLYVAVDDDDGAIVDDDDVTETDDYVDVDDAWTLLYGDGDDYYEEDFSLWYELRDSTAEDYRRVFSKQVSSTKAQPPVSFLTVSLCFCLCLVMLVPYVLSVRKSFKIARKLQRRQQQRKMQNERKNLDSVDGVMRTPSTSNPVNPTGAGTTATATTATRVTSVKNADVVDVNNDAFLFGGYDYYAAMKDGDSDEVYQIGPIPTTATTKDRDDVDKDSNDQNLVPNPKSEDMYNLAKDDGDGDASSSAGAADDDESSVESSVIHASASLYMDDGIMADDPNLILRDFASMIFNTSDQGSGAATNTATTNTKQGNDNDATGIMNAYATASAQISSSLDDDDDDDDDSVASGWIEQYDRKHKKTVYCNAVSGEIVTKKPVHNRHVSRAATGAAVTTTTTTTTEAIEVWNDEEIEHVEEEMMVNMTMTASSIGMDESYDLSTAESNSNLSSAGGLMRHPVLLIKTCCSGSSSNRMPWYFYYCSGKFLRKVRKSARHDDDMKSILSITIPFLTRTVVVDVFGLMEVGVIGRLLGTRALSAYFACELVIEVATMFLHGLPASLSSLVPQSIGAGNFRLAGLYTQLCVWSYLMLYFPCLLFWWNKFDGIVQWLGFDEETSTSAQQYGEFAMICRAVLIFDEALHCVLNAAGFEAYSTFMNGMKAFLSFMTVVMISSLLREEEEEELNEQEQFQQQMQERWADDDEEDEEETGIQASLWMIGAIHLVLTLFFLVSNIAIIACNGLLKKCRKGMLPWQTNPMSKGQPIRTFFRAAIPLSIGFLFKYCEFQLLFLFAAIMGPAQVAAWGLLGAIWQVAENLAIAFSTASKIRVANLLGSGRPSTAHYSSEKSLFLCVVFSCSLAALLGIFQSSVPLLFTHDETLQKLVKYQMPLLCLGVAVMSFASMAWAHLCAQGRSYLASGVTVLGSVFITLPLVSVSTFSLSYGLQGLLAGMILGYAASAFVCTVLVLTSDWSAISRIVMKRNIRRQKRLKKEKKIDDGSNILAQK